MLRFAVAVIEAPIAGQVRALQIEIVGFYHYDMSRPVHVAEKQSSKILHAPYTLEVHEQAK